MQTILYFDKQGSICFLGICQIFTICRNSYLYVFILINCCISFLKEVRYVSKGSQWMLILQLSKQQHQTFAEQLELKTV